MGSYEAQSSTIKPHLFGFSGLRFRMAHAQISGIFVFLGLIEFWVGFVGFKVTGS